MTQSDQQSGAWIFVSHSHRDLEKVREVRNYLESKGRNPLLFFLKCLDDDDARLPELVREEIEARDWFVLCDSPNARASKYVAKEREIVETLEGKVFETIDLEKAMEPQLHKLDRLSKRSTVFLSYARQDSEAADRIRAALLRHDFKVWLDSAIPPTEDWASVIESAIDEAASRGFILFLMSPASLTSEWYRHEMEYALQRATEAKGYNVVPIILAPIDHKALPVQLAGIQWLDLTTGPSEERLEELIFNLKARTMD